MYNFYLKLFIF